MPFSHTVYRCYLQVVWYQATVCKPWPPFFQKVVTKVSPRNTRSQSNMTIIWACHCCSKILVLTLFYCWHYSSIMFLLFDFIVLMDLTLISHEDYFIPLQTKFWRYTVVRGGRSYPESLCFSIHFVCLKTKNFQTRTSKLQYDFISKSKHCFIMCTFIRFNVSTISALVIKNSQGDNR